MKIFYWACKFGKSMIAQILIKKSAEFHIDLIAKDKSGTTAFQFATLNKNLIKAEIFMN